jgi:hypothetical protein
MAGSASADIVGGAWECRDPSWEFPALPGTPLPQDDSVVLDWGRQTRVAAELCSGWTGEAPVPTRPSPHVRPHTPVPTRAWALREPKFRLCPFATYLYGFGLPWFVAGDSGRRI